MINFVRCFQDAQKGFHSCIEKAKETFTQAAHQLSKGAKKVAFIGKTIFQEIGALIQRSKGRPSIEFTNSLLKEAEDIEAYYQILAHKLSYDQVSVGDDIQKSHKFNCPEYKAEKILTDSCGLKMLFLAPKDATKRVSPLVIIRGTDEKNAMNIIDDFSKEIGSINFDRKQKHIKKALEEFALKYGAIHILGQSFGGTFAQRVTAEFPEYIARCTHYNAPGVGKKYALMYDRKINSIPAGCYKPLVYSFRHAKDILSLLGGKHIKATEGCDVTFGTTKDTISHIYAHSVLSLFQKHSEYFIKEIQHDYKCVAKLAECCRKKLSPIASLIGKCYNAFTKAIHASA